MIHLKRLLAGIAVLVMGIGISLFIAYLLTNFLMITGGILFGVLSIVCTYMVGANFLGDGKDVPK